MLDAAERRRVTDKIVHSFYMTEAAVKYLWRLNYERKYHSELLQYICDNKLDVPIFEIEELADQVRLFNIAYSGATEAVTDMLPKEMRNSRYVWSVDIEQNLVNVYEVMPANE